MSMLGRVRHRTSLTVQELACLSDWPSRLYIRPRSSDIDRRNLARFGDRCRVVETAIWDQDAELVIERSHREWGLVVRPRQDGDPPEWPTVAARSVGSVLADYEPGEEIDFQFMDIEGAEQRVLEAGDAARAQRVRCIRVECENEYDADSARCRDALAQLGFEVRVEPVSWGAFVFGLRPASQSSRETPWQD